MRQDVIIIQVTFEGRARLIDGSGENQRRATIFNRKLWDHFGAKPYCVSITLRACNYSEAYSTSHNVRQHSENASETLIWRELTASEHEIHDCS